MSAVRKYIAISNRSLQNVLSYRVSYVITFASNLVSLITLFFLWNGIYGGRPELGAYSWEEMKAYLLVTFFANSMLSWYSETAISTKILDGSVAVDLLKPINFQKARLAESAGSVLLEGGISGVMIGAFIIFTAGIQLPDSLLQWFLFILSLIGSILVKFGVVYLAALLCFWSTGSLGIVWTRIAVTNLLSGALVPLSFFPGWLERIALLLPFQSIIYTPTMIFLGKAGAGELAGLVLMQFFWAAVLWFAGRLLWSWAVRQVTIHGG
ncbi:ABC-2 family transporter protein [Paenibacillus sp. JX-17]|uniref:ABC-2 family transporter protein n=1 Tax=Paenibacillus lacisoli TaxID=3064525 RepID=A0ABT9C9H1_9BACL|nr:ABC-2 family transporter protein [Paenibacillus sp. JX-17]MDO7905913.1 ABC-2 family transporter protein [Paenibacillus sp. JX-17]